MARKYVPYSQYKPSGVAWLGDVPRNWGICAIKYVSKLNPPKSQIRSNENDECSFVPMEKLKTDSLVLDETRQISEVYGGYTCFQDNDVLLAKVTPCFENKNIALAKGLQNGIGFGSSEIYVLRAGDKVNSRYLFYRLQEDGFMEVGTSSMTGAGGLRRVPSEVINNFLSALPSLKEQTKIAAFLDHETARIDTLIEKQRRLIELLKEKRQAVISHAVTKGLNPDAPMKDSGVEWLGEVPEHWEHCRIGHIARVSNGATPSRENLAYWDGGTIGWLNSSKINDVVVQEAEQFITPLALSETSVQPVRPQDLLMAITGEGQTRGRVAICKTSATINQHLASITLATDSVLPEYMFFWLTSRYSRIRFESEGAGSTKGAITCGDILHYPVPMPPVEEQKEICSHLYEREIALDLLLKKGSRQIALLHERRTALISAAVTGKIDVRNWEATDD